MRKIVALAALIALPLLAVAQDAMGPPKVLLIEREDVKPGKALAHEKSETAWTEAVVRAKWDEHFLAVTTASGPSQAWFIFAYDSFAAMEKDQQAQEKSAAMTAAATRYSPPESDFISENRSMVATLVSDITYHAPAPADLATMRYFRVRTSRVKIGHDEEYIELRKLLNSAYERAGVKMPSATFHVVLGAPAGTYMTFFPMKSAAELDSPPNLREVLGSDYDHFMSLVDKAVLGYSDDMVQFNPKMSYALPEWIKADPNFWAPKPGVIRASTSGGEANKTAVVPAAMKDAKTK